MPFFSAFHLSTVQLLYKIDKTTGKATNIGDTGVKFPPFVSDIEFDSTGTLYAISNGASLWTIDTTTAVSTSLNGGNPIAPSTIHSIMFDHLDNMFATTFTNPGFLYSVDLSSFSTTLIGDTGINKPQGGSFGCLPPT